MFTLLKIEIGNTLDSKVRNEFIVCESNLSSEFMQGKLWFLKNYGDINIDDDFEYLLSILPVKFKIGTDSAESFERITELLNKFNH